MKIERSKIIDPLMLVCGVAKGRSNSILDNVLISSDGGHVYLTGQSDNISVEVKIDSPDVISACVNAKKIGEVVKSLPESMINFDVSEQMLIKSGRSKYKLATIPPSEYPALPDGRPDVVIYIQANVLAKLIGSTSYAMAQNDVRHYINGMLIQLADNKITAVATDGHRLALASTVVEKIDGVERSAIVPGESVMKIASILSKFGTTVGKLSIEERYIHIEFDNVKITSRTVDGRFPDYNRVIPKRDESVTVHKKDLAGALSRVSILSNEKYRSGLINIADGLAHVRARNTHDEEAEDVVSVDGDLVTEFPYNVTYMIDALNAVDGDKAEIFFGGENTAAIVCGVDDVDSFGIVMPMRL